jgi:hypothetical protein
MGWIGAIVEDYRREYGDDWDIKPCKYCGHDNGQHTLLGRCHKCMEQGVQCGDLYMKEHPEEFKH